LPDGAVVLGEQGIILWFNRAAQALLGLRVSHDIGIRIANLIRHPSFTDYIANQAYEGEIEVPSPINRAVSLALRIIPYGNNQRLMIVRDVSEIRRLETARRDFVSNASHELRTPLTVLRGYLDMLDPETREGRSLADWRMPISEMRQQSARMESLINDMLKLARLESDVYEHKQELLDAPMILGRAIDEGRSMSGGQHRFEINVQPGLLLFGREVEAQSIFSNLITNAVRYTPAGGVIRVSWWDNAEGAHLAVADSGIGISEDDIPRLTERFYRVDVGRSRASGGTGLGLSIVKHALERHEGTLRIESEPGVGSTFYCDFPPHRAHRREAGAALAARAG
jgi:two-component system phosphate regulon sensor histidine kinase PhoR